MRLTTHARKQLVFRCFAALRGVRAQAKIYSRLGPFGTTETFLPDL
jgi:hypothetical protein